MTHSPEEAGGSEQPRSPRPFSNRVLLLMMVVGLLLRFVLVFLLDGNMLLRGDEGIYTELGPKFFSNGFDTGPFVRPPLYFVFLALIHAISGPDSWILVAKLVQCVAGTAVAVPVYRTAFRLAGTRSALFAAGFILFDPTLVAFTHLLWPETVFLLTIAIVFDGLVGLDERTPWRSVGLGTLTGLAMLLKPVFGVFTLLLAVHWLFSRGLANTLKIALVFGGAAAVVISPWVIRNLQLFGPSIIMENQGPYNLWSGNSPEHPVLILREWVDLGDPLIRSRTGTQRGREAIAEDPARFARISLVRALNFWGLEYFVVRHLAIGGYNDISKRTFLIWFWVIQFGWAVTWIAAAVGIGVVLRDPILRLAVLYSAVLWVIVSAMVVTTRFRVPLAFWLAIAAGIGIERIVSRRIGRRTLVPVVAALIVLILSASRPMFQTMISADFEVREELERRDWRFFRY